MSVLARERKLSKLEFYMNARRLYKKILFLMVRDFGIKPRARQPTFYTRGWDTSDKELFEAIAACESLKQTLELVVDILPVKADKLLPYVDAINREIALLKGWRKADNKRNKTLK